MTAPEPSPKRVPPNADWSTLSVHAGEELDKPQGALTYPIFCATTYTFRDTKALVDYIVQKQPREEYARYGNPTGKAVERKLAVLEGAEDAVLYATGMAAIAGLLLGKLRSGDELVLFDECYVRTRDLCEQHLSRFGIVTHLSRRATMSDSRPPLRRPRGS